MHKSFGTELLAVVEKRSSAHKNSDMLVRTVVVGIDEHIHILMAVVLEHRSMTVVQN